MLNILFLLQKNRTNQKGTCPIRCRITYLKTRKEFSTGLFIKPEHWQNTKQKAHPPNEENNFINTQLSLIQNKMNQAFLFLQLQQVVFNVDAIYKQYLGETQNKDKSLLEAFHYHNSKMEKLVGIEISENTLKKYRQTLNHVKAFVWFKFKRKTSSSPRS